MALNRGPAPVPGYQTTPAPIGPLTSPPPSGGGPSSFVMPLAPRATTMNTSTRFIEIDYNGDIITSAVTSMNFVGDGVIVTNDGSAVTIDIPGGNGTPSGPNNSLQFNSSGTLAGNSKLVFDPSTSILTVTGNVHANYFVGSALRLTNIPGSNVFGSVPNSDTANFANVANTVSVAAQPNITSVGTLTSVSVTGNVTGGNIRTVGAVSATGNVTGQYILGNGSFLSGLPSSYNNSNVIGLLASFDNNIINTTGNVTGGVIAGTRVSASGNVTGGNVTTAGLISATGNIAGNYFIGNGSQLTGIVANTTYGNSNVVTLLAGFGSNTISTTGNVTGGNIIGNIVGGGAGTPTVASTTNLDLSAATAVRVIGGGTFRLPTLTSAQIANITAVNGDMVYNSTTSKIQAYANNAWGNITLS